MERGKVGEAPHAIMLMPLTTNPKYLQFLFGQPASNGLSSLISMELINVVKLRFMVNWIL